MSVAATLADTCLVTALPMSFPNYTGGTGPVTATTTISVRCTNGARYAVGLSAGTNAGTSFSQRLLANGTNSLQYNLYVSNAYSSVWGDGSSGTSVISGISSGFGNAVSLTVYGELPDNVANQGAVPGVYTDTILVVMTY